MDLLANVGALLADTQSLLTRLQDGDGGDLEDGDFFAAETHDVRQPTPPPSGSEQGADSGSLPEEIATDNFYEFQVGPSQCFLVLTCLKAWHALLQGRGIGCTHQRHGKFALRVCLCWHSFGKRRAGHSVSGWRGRRAVAAGVAQQLPGKRM